MGKALKILKLSASAIKTYEQCPRKYYYTYIDRLPRKDWPHFKLGNFVHAALEDFHNALLEDPNQERKPLLLEICRKRLPEFQLDHSQKEAVKPMLNDYLHLLNTKGLPDVLVNEQGFNFNIDGDILLRGYIDRIDRDSERDYHIVDYKTGKSKYLDEFQLLVYGLYLRNKHPDLKSFRGSYLALSEGAKMISSTFTTTDLDRCEMKIKKVANQIRTEQAWETKRQFLCDYCDFKEVCPAFAKKDNADEDWVGNG